MWRFTLGGFPGRAVLFVWMSLLVVAGAGQATLVADTHVNAALPTMPSGAISNVNVGGGYTGLLQFDLGLLPAGTTLAQISRAVLRVYVNRMDTAGLVSIAPVTSPWSEYKVTYQTIPAMGAVAQTFPVSQAGAFVAVDVTSLVQGWVSGQVTNFGVALTASTAVLEIDSKENDLTGHAATLDVTIMSQGPAGVAGQNGLPGATGPAGPAGATGPAGSIGLPGTAGATGATGPMGPPVTFAGGWLVGTAYAVGDAVSYGGSSYIAAVANSGRQPNVSPVYWGLLALAGSAGTTGPAGQNGLPGAAGPAGPVGATGPAGSNGLSGVAGSAGAPGASGPQGPPVTFMGGWLVGPAYAVGDAVSYGGSSYIAAAANSGRQPDVSPAYWGLLALAGSAGATGPTGYTGQAGATGPAGQTGATGLQGQQGLTGPIGPQGLAGTNGSNGVNGAVGSQGPQGVAGPQGATGAAGMNFRGAWSLGAGYGVNDAVTYGGATYLAQAPNNGVQPDSNAYDWAVLAAAGGAGPTGAAGAVASVQIGTVTTGAAGSSAAVTNSGTANAAVLNFTIPQGAAGSGGSGGGGGTSGIPYQMMYHSVSYTANYYSLNTSNQSATETAAVMTWVPNGCSATQLVAFSQQGATITVTLRSGTAGTMSDSALSCSVATGQSCTATGAVAVPAGGFIDLGIYHPNSTASGVWVGVSCN